MAEGGEIPTRPTRAQQAIIDAVCGLTNALLAPIGRDGGKAWMRHHIAARLIADDDV